MPTLFARFYNNGADLFEKAKQVACCQNYQIASEDPASGTLHMHKKVSGKMVHILLYIGSGKDRGVKIDVMPGDEGYYMDCGRQFIEELKMVAR